MSILLLEKGWLSWKNLLMLGTLFLLVLVPKFANPYIMNVMIMILFYAFLGQSWNILGGYCGQLSFGHAAFLGIGAYTSTVLYIKLGVTPWIGMFIGGLLGMLAGIFIGYVSFKYSLKGIFFALVTLSFAEILRLIALNWWFIGGGMGILIPTKGTSFSDFQFISKTPFYYMILVLLILILLITAYIERSRMGSYFFAIREDEEAAESLGVNTLRYKIIASAISSFFTALGGTFFAQLLLFIYPDTVFGVDLSTEILLRPMIGGVGTKLGPVFGAFLLGPVSEITRELFKGYSGVYLMIYGLIIVFVVLYMPDGILGWLRRLSDRFTEKKIG
jgi:branched-chain amino acid transport system permease protein